MIACWCLLKSILMDHICTNTIKRIFVVGSHTGQRLGLRDRRELLLVQVQAWLCLCVTLWYVRPFYGQLMKWPAWQPAHAEG